MRGLKPNRGLTPETGRSSLTNPLTQRQHRKRKTTQMLALAKSLRHNEHRLSRAQAISHCGSWELEFKTGLAHWSDESCRIYGFDTSNNVHTFEQWLSYVHPDDLQAVIKVIEDAQPTHADTSMVHCIVRPDGEIRHVHGLTFFEFDKAGVPIGLYGVVHDITAAVAASKAMSEIRWKQCHELRAPLARMLAMIDILPDASEADQRTFLENVVVSARELDGIISSIVKSATAEEQRTGFALL